MADYINITDKERKLMLREIGVARVDELFEDIPEHFRLSKLDLPSGKSQQETMRLMGELSTMNTVFPVIMRGAGSYNHYIPSIVPALANRSEFLTAYTPYQPEISQGLLQAIFEYQSLICALTGMDVSNASLYNGSTAAADAVMMTLERGRNRIFLPENILPDTMSVINSYLTHKNVEINIIPLANGRIDASYLEANLDAATAAVFLQQPNYYGLIEDAERIGQLVHAVGGRLVMSCNPISLAILKSPREVGADIAVGEAQPLGMPLAFGGPYLGFIACLEKEVRRMPGRIVGETITAEGERAFVLTLQAREQHIRREKALSNICSNQAHCALTATIYLAAMGREGLREVAESCLAMAHYAADCFVQAGARLKYKGEFFHEFVTITKSKADEILAKLARKGILGGLRLSEHEILWCMTEMVEKADVKKVAQIIKSAVKGGQKTYENNI